MQRLINYLYMLILPWLANPFNFDFDIKLLHRKLQTNVRKFPLPRKKLSSCLSTVTLFHVYVCRCLSLWTVCFPNILRTTPSQIKAIGNLFFSFSLRYKQPIRSPNCSCFEVQNFENYGQMLWVVWRQFNGVNKPFFALPCTNTIRGKKNRRFKYPWPVKARNTDEKKSIAFLIKDRKHELPCWKCSTFI